MSWFHLASSCTPWSCAFFSTFAALHLLHATDLHLPDLVDEEVGPELDRLLGSDLVGLNAAAEVLSGLNPLVDDLADLDGPEEVLLGLDATVGVLPTLCAAVWVPLVLDAHAHVRPGLDAVAEVLLDLNIPAYALPGLDDMVEILSGLFLLVLNLVLEVEVKILLSLEAWVEPILLFVPLGLNAAIDALLGLDAAAGVPHYLDDQVEDV